MNIIDRAYEIQTGEAQKEAWDRLMSLEAEIVDYDYEMYSAWIELCKVKGIAPDANAELPVVAETDELRQLYDKFIHFSKLFTTAVRHHERLCNRLGIKRQIFPNIQRCYGAEERPGISRSETAQRGSHNESTPSNNRASKEAQPDSGRRPIGSGGGQRVSRRRKKRQRR